MTAPIQTNWKSLIDDVRDRLDSLESMLANTRTVESPNEMEIVVRIFAKHFGVNYDDVMAIKKTGHLSRCRHACFLAIKTLCPDISQVEIGEFMNGRDHACVSNSITRAACLIQNEPRFYRKYSTAFMAAKDEFKLRKIVIDE